MSGPQYTLTGLALQTLMGMGVSAHDERIPTGNGAGFFTFRLSRKQQFDPRPTLTERLDPSTTGM